MKDESHITREPIRWRFIFAGWTLIGLFFISRNIVTQVIRGQPLIWYRTVLTEMLYWQIWALFTPWIFRFVRRHKIERGRWLYGLPPLIIFGLIVSLLHLMVEYAIDLPLTHLVMREPAVEMNQMIVLIRRGLIIGSFTDFLTYSVIVGVYYAFNYYHKYREREVRASQLEGRLAQAELQNLKMQLHPHFLFNTLHAISVLMQEDVQAANRMLVLLSNLLRVTLDNAGTHEVSLKQELEFLQSYLEIEQTRFHDRLTVRLDVDPSALDARVPNLILQPLVENAIRHGIAPRATAGKVEIRAAREDGSIRLEVQDDGPGLPASGKAGGVKGVGLSNTRARLEQLYGSRHQFDMSNAEGGGLIVSITIPFRIE